MIPECKYSQYGEQGLVIKGIVIHNTNSPKSARDLFEWLSTDNTTSQGCHFLIDETETIEVMPLNWKTWSTGKGNDYAFNYCIAVEICDHGGEDAEKRAVRKIKALMKKYSLTVNELYFHIEFNERTYCPHLILEKYRNKANFIRRYFK